MTRDIREALRSLVASPGLTLMVVVTLALAIGANTAIFSVLNDVLLKPLGYPEPERLVMLWENNREQGLEQVQTSAGTYIDWRERSRALESVAAYRYLGYTLTEFDEPERITSAEVSPDLFSLLRAEPALGRTLLADDEIPGGERIAVVSHSMWTRRFAAEPDIIGRSIRLDGEPHTVVGVMSEGFEFPPGDPDVEIWSPLTLNMEALLSRPHRMYNAIGRLAEGATLEAAQREMDAIAADLARENPQDMEGWAVELVTAHEQLVGDIGPTLWILFGAVFMVLLIGCANVANLLLVRSTKVAKDFAVRAAMGAGRISLLRRSAVESLLLAILGGAAGLAVALAGMRALRALIPATVPRVDEIGLDLNVLAFTIGASLLAGVLSGAAPAFRTMRPDLSAVLQDSARGSGLGRRSRVLAGLLVAVEVAMAVVVPIGAGLLVRSFLRLTAVDPGFRTSEVVSVAVSLPRTRYPQFDQQEQFFEELLARVRAVPGVEAAGAVSALPMSPVGIDFDLPFTIEGLEAESPTERPRADYRAAMPGYFEAMRIPLASGRLLDSFDGEEGRDVTLVNRSLAERYFPNIDPVGRIVSMPMAGSLEIVGVVGDVRHSGLQAQAKPELFVPLAQFPLTDMHVVIHTRGDTDAMAAAVRAQVLQLDPDLPVTATAGIDDLISDTVAQPRFNMALLVGLAFCAIALAAVGIYGVVAYSVAQRTGEIGLRMALGADASGTARLVVLQSLRMVIAGVVVGLIAATILARFIASLLFGIGPTDLGTYTLVAGGIILIGLLAATIPALRTARVDPAVALRRA